MIIIDVALRLCGVASIYFRRSTTQESRVSGATDPDTRFRKQALPFH